MKGLTLAPVTIAGIKAMKANALLGLNLEASKLNAPDTGEVHESAATIRRKKKHEADKAEADAEFAANAFDPERIPAMTIGKWKGSSHKIEAEKQTQHYFWALSEPSPGQGLMPFVGYLSLTCQVQKMGHLLC